MIYKYAIDKLANKGINAKLLIFNFHNIACEDDILSSNSLSIEKFKTNLNWINETFDILPLDTAIERCLDGTLDRASACLTFDDGYESHYSIVKPLLEKINAKGTFFISSEHLEQNLLWHDLLCVFDVLSSDKDKQELSSLVSTLIEKEFQYCRDQIEFVVKYLTLETRKPILEYLRKFIPNDLEAKMMSKKQIVELHKAGHNIGAHTADHPILALESENTAQQQIVSSIQFLSRLLDQDIDTFAYPNGKSNKDYSATHIGLLQQTQLEAQ